MEGEQYYGFLGMSRYSTIDLFCIMGVVIWVLRNVVGAVVWVLGIILGAVVGVF